MFSHKRTIPPSLPLETRMELYETYSQVNPSHPLIPMLTATNETASVPATVNPSQDSDLDDIFGSLKQKRKENQSRAKASNTVVQ